MGKYRKKPVVIDAVQFTGYNMDEIIEFNGNDDEWTYHDRTDASGFGHFRGAYISMPTLEGEHIAIENDYIIRGVKGEYYPCKPDVFALTYEKV